MSGQGCDRMMERYDDGDRSPEVLAHARSCAACGRLLGVDDAVQAWSPAGAADADAFLARLRPRMASEPARRVAWLPWAVAAAAVAVAAVAVEALRRERARPPTIVTTYLPSPVSGTTAPAPVEPAPVKPAPPDALAGFRERLLAASQGVSREDFLRDLRDPRLRNRWISCFQSEDDAERKAALALAESSGDRTVVRDLARAAARGSSEAIASIGRLGGPEAVVALAPLAGAPGRRQAVIEALATTGRPEAAEVLAVLGAWDAEAAWRRLGPAADGSIAPRLRAGDRAEPGAIRAAGWSRSPSAVRELEQLLRRGETRQAAAEALGEIGSPSAMAALARAATPPDPAEPGPVDPVFTALKRPTGRLELERRVGDTRLQAAERAAAAALLGALGDETSSGALVRALEDPTLRPAACRALAALRAPSAVPALAALLADRRSRDAAAAALGAIGRPEALPALIAASRDREFRDNASAAIASIGGPEAVPYLVSALSDRRTAAVAIASLERARDPRAVPHLIDALGGEQSEAALRALEAITGEKPGRTRGDWIRWYRSHAPGGGSLA